MRITKRKVKNKLRRYIPIGKIQDSDLSRVKCIRHTITWRCNYKCTSCDIWTLKGRKHDEATPAEIDRMGKSPLLSDVTEVIISGGEPTLRDDFVELMLAYHRNLPKATFGITINGYDPDRAYRFFKQIRQESRRFTWHVIGVSLNGRREVHNKSRGLDCYDRVIETAERLQEFSGNVGFSFTFLEDNVQDFHFVKDLAKSKGMSVHPCWSVENDRFVASKKKLNFEEDTHLVPALERHVEIEKIKRNGSVERDFIRYKPNIKLAYLYDSILNRRVMPCNAAQTFFHIAPYGDIYPCNFDLREERILGNIKTEPIETILSRVNKQLLHEIKCGTCMYPNGKLCGDSDIARSINQVDTPVFEWYKAKRRKGERLIKKADSTETKILCSKVN